jgi:hypothetical protein
MFNVSSILSVYQRCCQLDEKDAIFQSYLFAFEEQQVFFIMYLLPRRSEHPLSNAMQIPNLFGANHKHETFLQ